jgi:hypothetical protein
MRSEKREASTYKDRQKEDGARRELQINPFTYLFAGMGV